MTNLRWALKKYVIILCVSYSILPWLSLADVTESSASQSSSSYEAPENLDELEAQLENTKPIDVTNTVSDDAIQARIENILRISDWFTGLTVRSAQGVVIIDGLTPKREYREWAGNVASRTEGAVAVINKIAVDPGSESGLSPIIEEGELLWQKMVSALPPIAISLAILFIFFLLAKYVAALGLRVTENKIPSVMLRRLISNIVAAPVLLIGIYLVLRITGLTKIAATVVGGTGLIGLVLGFAFRDIVENFLASVLISIQRPFRLGETIQVLNFTGVVQAVTTRGTVLMTLEGNHVQIPNTTIYKEAIVNLSANPNIRMDFMVGIGYDASIADAQDIALRVLVDHPAVLSSPEPWVLAEALSASTVNLRIYFWVNNSSHNPLKVKSAVIRNVKYAFMKNNISMPDDAREVIFPNGLHVFNELITSPSPQNTFEKIPDEELNSAEKRQSANDKKECTEAEGNLDSDIPTIKFQAQQYVLDTGDTGLLSDSKK